MPRQARGQARDPVEEPGSTVESEKRVKVEADDEEEEEEEEGKGSTIGAPPQTPSRRRVEVVVFTPPSRSSGSRKAGRSQRGGSKCHFSPIDLAVPLRTDDQC